MMKRENFPVANIYVPVKRRSDARSGARRRHRRKHAGDGQQTPILVRPDGARFVLVEGLHRLEAAKALGEEHHRRLSRRRAQALAVVRFYARLVPGRAPERQRAARRYFCAVRILAQASATSRLGSLLPGNVAQPPLATKVSCCQESVALSATSFTVDFGRLLEFVDADRRQRCDHRFGGAQLCFVAGPCSQAVHPPQPKPSSTVSKRAGGGALHEPHARFALQNRR